MEISVAVARRALQALRQEVYRVSCSITDTHSFLNGEMGDLSDADYDSWCGILVHQQSELKDLQAACLSLSAGVS